MKRQPTLWLMLPGAAVTVVLAGMVCAAGELPPSAQPGVGGCVSAELIFPLDDKPTPQCHASTIAQTKDGGLVAAWFGGQHESHSDVGIWVARLEDGRWTRSVEVADGSEGETKQFPCWNPVLFQPREGPLMLFYKVGPSPNTWWGVLITSADGGKTWGTPTRLSGKHPETGPLVGPIKNKPVQLEDGTILCPSSSEHNGWRVHFEATRDLGKTWEVIGPINDGKKFGAIQPSILMHRGGKLQVLCRSLQNVVTESWSPDGGKTWTEMTATNLPNPNAGVDAVTLKDGRHVIVYNPTTANNGNRAVLAVAISADGKDWQPIVTLENEGKDGEFSYPAVIQAADGKLHITYTYQRRSVKHVVLDPKEINTP
ncbi:MAG: sialidase family protein [Pirellulales bacterium]